MRRLLHLFVGLTLLVLPVLASARHYVLVDAKSLTLREKPAKTAAALTDLVTFQPVEVLKQSEGWTQVKTKQGQTGWVLSSYLTKNAFVSTDRDQLNARRGPGTDYEVWIEYKQQNLPLCVLDVDANGWLLVMDYEGDRGWVNSKMIKNDHQYVIARKAKCNVRKTPTNAKELAFVAEKGLILQAVEEQGDLVKVRYTDGSEGWIAKEDVFGSLDEKDPALAKEESPKKTTAKSTRKKSSDQDDDDEKTTVKKRSTRKRSTASADEDEAPAKKKSVRKASASADDDEPAPTRKRSSRRKSSASQDDESVKSSSKTAQSDDDDPPAKKTSTRRHRTTRKSTQTADAE